MTDTPIFCNVITGYEMGILVTLCFCKRVCIHVVAGSIFTQTSTKCDFLKIILIFVVVPI